MTAQIRPDSGTNRTAAGARAPAKRAGPRLVPLTSLLLGVIATGTGLWALLGPGSFAGYTGFTPYNEHFVHDLGAFQLGLGVALLLSLAWRDGPAVALAGFLAGDLAHAANHWVDLDLGGRPRELALFLALAVLAGWALVVRLRELGGVLGKVATTSSPTLARFVRQKTTLLTTFRRDGRAVATPVSVAVEGDHAYFRSWTTAGKAKRLAHTPAVRLAPCRTRGEPTGPAIDGNAERLDGAEAAHAARLLRRKHPFLHGVFVPGSHKAFRYTTVHYRLTPATEDSAAEALRGIPD